MNVFPSSKQGQGEDTICSEEFPIGINAKTLLMEWRKACENVFKHASIQLSCSKFGNSVTFIISDPRCNEHITCKGCVERPVRLPAALKGARLAAANAGEKIEFLLSVGDEYMTLAEQKVIGQAHSSAYLKRMRLKCAAIAPGTRGVPLTDDSNNEGGEDTSTFKWIWPFTHWFLGLTMRLVLYLFVLTRGLAGIVYRCSSRSCRSD